MTKLILCLEVLLVLFTSCNKEIIDSEKDMAIDEWKVKKIRKEGGSYLYATEDYIFKFNTNNTFNLNLDVNGCIGQYIIGKGSIEIAFPSCTEICCDSYYANELIHLLPEMTRYSLENNRLVFEGQGEIIFEKKE